MMTLFWTFPPNRPRFKRTPGARDLKGLRWTSWICICHKRGRLDTKRVSWKRNIPGHRNHRRVYERDRATPCEMECCQLLHSCWKNRTLSMAWNWWMTLKVTEGHRKWLWLAVNQFLLVVCINNFCTLHHFRDIITDIEDTYQTWNWVIGSPGKLGHLSRPGHRVIIMTRCETRVFPVFEKMPKMQNWQTSCPLQTFVTQLRDKYSLAWDDANLAFWRRI